MPELPEVQTIRLQLQKHLVGRVVSRVEIFRASVVRLGEVGQPRRKPAEMVTAKALLEGQKICSIERLGKQLFLVGEKSRLCIHLGMSGSLRFFPVGHSELDKHCHVVWELKDSGKTSQGFLVFRDPRRFGGIWFFENEEAFHKICVEPMGPDALTVTTEHLIRKFKRTHRAIKAVLLDQSVLAGMGNIYVDEALFAAGIDPRALAHRIAPVAVEKLAKAARDILERAVIAGGSTVRTYVDGAGKQGGFQFHHAVYGRGGEPCRNCGRELKLIGLAGRATVFCAICQKR